MKASIPSKPSSGDVAVRSLPAERETALDRHDMVPSEESPAIKEVRPERPVLATGPIPTLSGSGAQPRALPSTLAGARAAQLGANRTRGPSEYRIGEEDQLQISVYGDSELSQTQTVRPDGKIAFPLIGEVQVVGLTPDEVRARITTGIALFVKNPRVTVVVSKYSSKRASILGEVKNPGLLYVSSDVTLFEAIARVGGLTESANLQGAVLVRDGQSVPVEFDKLMQGDASHNLVLKPNDVVLIPDIKDKRVFVLGQVSKPGVVTLKAGLTLVEAISRVQGVTDGADPQGAMLVRDGQVLPVNFDKLLRQGDASQNVLLHANDLVLIPDLKDRKVSVLGEVTRPGVVSLRPGVTLVESIAAVGGFTADAQPKSVLIVRGGLGDPRILTVNVARVTEAGGPVRNVTLEPGDIVYVPRSFVADTMKFFQNLTIVLTPFVLAASGIVLGAQAKSVFTGQGTGTTAVAVPVAQ